MVVVPGATPVDKPLVAIVATPVDDELQATVLVRVCVLPSLNVPIAEYCWVDPTFIDDLAGVTAIDVNAFVIVRDVVPATAPEVAVIVAVPAARPVASPPAPIVATLCADEFHVTEPVRLLELPSLNVPVAVNCSVIPTTIEGFAGVTAIDESVTGGGVDDVEDPPPQPVVNSSPAVTSRNTTSDRSRC
jgi:hypothetical protein